MAEQDNDQEKTEQPSAKRLKDAREKGQVARSKELSATLILLSCTTGLLFFGHYCTEAFMVMMRQAFEFNRDILNSPQAVLPLLYLLLFTGFKAVLPLLLVVLVISIAAPLVMGGWVFSGQAFAPQLSRLSPLKGFKRMVSLKGLAEMFKSLLKFMLIALVTLTVLKWQLPKLLMLNRFPLENGISSGAYLVGLSLVVICASLILIACLDVPFQLYEHHKQLKMTKQEVRDEYKEVEGKPEIKSQIRKAQQEIARRRMMSDIEKADVVLTNPTHYAVAISYQKNGNRAPVVVAKGQDLIALQIARIAKNQAVPVLSLPPLARAIYFSTKLNNEIPRGLYVAVAQVLAYIFQLRHREDYEVSPVILQNLPIPDELKRDTEHSV